MGEELSVTLGTVLTLQDRENKKIVGNHCAEDGTFVTHSHTLKRNTLGFSVGKKKLQISKGGWGLGKATANSVSGGCWKFQYELTFFTCIDREL